MVENDLRFWAVLWAGAAGLGIVRHWGNRSGVGLILTYIMSFGAIHWLAAAIYLLPWYSDRGEDLVALGLRQATLATVALAIGAEIVGWVMRLHRPKSVRGAKSTSVALDPLAVNVYLIAGMMLYGVISPLGARLPSLQALVATGSTVTLIALSLKCWNGWQRGEPAALWRWLGASSLMPIVTVVTQGFLGYGFAAMVTIFSFVASFFRPRWKVVVAGLVLAYLGLSVYVTYMRDREDIRAVVWGGKGLSDRVDQLRGTFAEMEWFDLQDVNHLKRIDARLNQDYLVGAAVAHLARGVMPFAAGGTFVDAALGVIPRALWPNKPTTGGSGDLVTTYTGLRFAEGTSVGVGQVMECYINFGTAGVIGGFLLIGGLLALADRKSAEALHRGDVRGFTLWYMPSLSLLQVGGSLVEVTSTAAAGLLMAIVINHVILRLHQRRAVPRARVVVVGTAPPEARL